MLSVGASGQEPPPESTAFQEARSSRQNHPNSQPDSTQPPVDPFGVPRSRMCSDGGGDMIIKPQGCAQSPVHLAKTCFQLDHPEESES